MNRRQLLLGVAAVAVAPLPAVALPARLLDKAEHPYQELIAAWIDAKECTAARILEENAAVHRALTRLHRKHIAALAEELVHG